jgi:Tfp pilus assembly protein PilF
LPRSGSNILARLGPGALLRLALLLTFAVYARCLTFDFVYDDAFQILQNPWIQSWRYLPHYFTSQVWGFAFPDWKGNYYRPLFLLWLRLNHALFGTIPGWWHLTTLAAHLLTTCLVYVLGRRLLRDPWAAALAALLFGVAPIHLEAVAWVSGVPEVLFTAALIASFLYYLDSHERRHHEGVRLAAGLAFYAVALLTKETALVLPLLLITYELAWGTGWRAMARRVAPYLGVTVAYLGVRAWVLGGMSNAEYGRSWTTVVLTWPWALLLYLRQLLWPFHLALYYDLDLVPRAASRAFVLPLLVLAGVTVLIWMFVRGRRRASFAVLAMVLPLLPALVGLIAFQPHDYVHDRYLYLPSVALALLLAAGLMRVRIPAPWRAAVVALLTAALALSTFQQSLPWKSDAALFARAVEVAPRNPLARYQLGFGLLGAHQTEAGLRLYREAIQLDPDYWLAVFNLGMAYYRLGRHAEADPVLLRSIELRPTQPIAYYYLGLIRMEAGRFAEAEAMLRRAVELRPYGLGYHLALGTVLEKLGRREEAQQEFRAEEASRSAYIARQNQFLH